MSIEDICCASPVACAGPCGFPYCPLRDVAPHAVEFDESEETLPLPPRRRFTLPITHANDECGKRRMMVVGTTCTGKTTLARALARLFNWPHVEFDGLFWNANWQYAPDCVVEERLQASTASPNWILDGNCLEFKHLVWNRTDTVIWLDYPLPLVLGRALKRTVRRCVTRELLWGKNVESWRRSLFSRDSALVWAMESWHQRRREYEKMLSGPGTRHMQIHRFRSSNETIDWLCRLCFEHNMAQGN